MQVRDAAGASDTDFTVRSARLAVEGGASALRAEGTADVEAIRKSLPDVPLIGLIKRSVPSSNVYITPELNDIEQLNQAGCEIVAIDATIRSRPVPTQTLIEAARAKGMAVVADCDTLESAVEASKQGADFLATTLSGYTDARAATTEEPDLRLVRQIKAACSAPVIAEGRYSEPWHVAAAMTSGASGVTIGSALNDPRKNAERLISQWNHHSGRIGCVDLGGTSLKLAVCDQSLQIELLDEIPTPHNHAERLEFIKNFSAEHELETIGVSSGGDIDTDTCAVSSSNPTIHFDAGDSFQISGLSVKAMNDGLCSAWGIANHPARSSDRFTAVALGTGVGCGVVCNGRLVRSDPSTRLGYPKLNVISTSSGMSLEDLYNQRHRNAEPSAEFLKQLGTELRTALEITQSFTGSDTIYFCGGFLLDGEARPRPWAADLLEMLALLPVELSPIPSPGLVGAAALVRYPPRFG